MIALSVCHIFPILLLTYPFYYDKFLQRAWEPYSKGHLFMKLVKNKKSAIIILRLIAGGVPNLILTGIGRPWSAHKDLR